MEVVRCTEAHRERWNAFVSGPSGASFYHRFEWREINEKSFGHKTCYIAALEDRKIVGVFPIVGMRSRLFGNIACSLPFVNYGGPVATSDDAREALLSEGERLAEEWKVDYLEIRSRTHLGERFVTSEHKVSMTIDLDRDSEVLWNKFKTGHRKEIRRGYKNGLTGKVGGRELLDDFYGVLSESWRDLGTPIYSKKYLERVMDLLGDSVRIGVVYAGSEAAAAAFTGIHNGTIEGMWMGSRSKFRNLLAGYVLYWELIKHGCELGCVSYHLGRSTAQSTGETFKKKWNAAASQLYWQYVLRGTHRIPQLNVQNPKYRLAIDTWRRLPVSVTQVVGPLVARSIP